MWPGALLPEEGVAFPFWSVWNFLQADSVPLLLGSHKSSSFPEMLFRTTASNCIKISRPIPKHCHFYRRNSNISIQADLTNWGIISPSSHLPLHLPIVWRVCPTPHVCRTLWGPIPSCVGNTCTSQQDANAVYMKNPLYFPPHIPERPKCWDYF